MVASSIAMPWVTGDALYDPTATVSYNLLDMDDYRYAGSGFVMPYRDFAFSLLVIGLIASVVTPAGGALLLLSTVLFWVTIPTLFLHVRDWIPEIGYGLHFALAGSVLIMSSMYLRMFVGRRHISVSVALRDIAQGLRTFSVGVPTPIQSVSQSTARVNFFAVIGIAIGAVSAFMVWIEQDQVAYSLIDLLTDETAYRHPPYEGRIYLYRGLPQFLAILYLAGLLLALRSPVFGPVQLTGALCLWITVDPPLMVYETYGPFLGVLSSLIIIHSLRTHVSLSRRPKLTIGGWNIYTAAGIRLPTRAEK